jgi:predicted 3-demethylubiquinone-9 3-methyltransferase (glyoxalase superfamily)
LRRNSRDPVEEGRRACRRSARSLWFDGNAEEAVNFYVSTFDDARVTDTSRYGDAGPGPAGTVMTMSFELYGQTFTP